MRGGWRTKLKPYCLLQHVTINNHGLTVGEIAQMVEPVTMLQRAVSDHGVSISIMDTGYWILDKNFGE